MNSKLILMSLLFGSTFVFFIQPGQSQSELIIYHEPVIEILDLIVNGTGGAWVNITSDFDYILRIVWSLDFIANSIDFDVFAGESIPLTNGFNVFYNDVTFTSGTIKANDDFGNIAYDLSIFTDDKNPKGRTILGRLSFFKFVPGGLLINSERILAFQVQDDITTLSSIDQLTVAVEGYKITTVQIFNQSVQRQDLMQTLEDFWRTNNLSILSLGAVVLGAIIIWRKFR